MNGNTPYAGRSGTVEAGKRSSADVPTLTPEQRASLRDSLAHIAARTREYLPSEYIVGAEITSGADGAQAFVAVQPPIGNAVSAGFRPDFEEGDAGLIDTDERTEVAQGLAASAALQVKQSLGTDAEPAAR